jgi:hypothetical protein
VGGNEITLGVEQKVSGQTDMFIQGDRELDAGTRFAFASTLILKRTA